MSNVQLSGIWLKNMEIGCCGYQYAHRNDRLMKRSNFVATEEDLKRFETLLTKFDVIEYCTRE